MTVHELAQLLKNFPSNMLVAVDGYEDGFDNAVNTKTISLALNANDEWYYGRHRQSKNEGAMEAVLIKGDRRTS